MSIRARLERVERRARDRLPHAAEVVTTTWRKVPDSELETFARLNEGDESKAADATFARLWPALSEHHEALGRALGKLDPLPPTDGRWYAPLPLPSDAAVGEALEVLDSSAPPEGEHDAWTVARLCARLSLAIRDAYA